jgi:peptidase E
MEFHLFSTPGEDDIRYILEASKPYLENEVDPIVAYLPLASLYAEAWLEHTERSFKGLAHLELVNAELMSQKEIEGIIRKSSLVYIPGGNTFLLNHRLHVSGVISYLRKRIQNGLPLVGFSAGTVLCGPNILTSKDMNTVETSHFEGLNLTPFNFLVHYQADSYGQSFHDNWLADYHIFHDNPVIMMADGAYVKAENRKIFLVRGEAWILRKDQEKKKLEGGKVISL